MRKIFAFSLPFCLFAPGFAQSQQSAGSKIYRDPLTRLTARDFALGCDQVEVATLAYLARRGFAPVNCRDCPPPSPLERAGKLKFIMYRSGSRLVDAQGIEVDTARMRGELAGWKAPWWLWSSPLHALVHAYLRPNELGCNLQFWVDFQSTQRSMVALIIPVGEGLGVPSNGKLETGYIEAIAQIIEQRQN